MGAIKQIGLQESREEKIMEIIGGIDLGFWGVAFFEMLVFGLLLVAASGQRE